MNRRRRLLFSLATAGLLLSSCIKSLAERGLEPTWKTVDTAQFVPGTTTRADVLKLVGVPSQVITLDGGTAFYYMQEIAKTDGLVLLVYNSRAERVDYERAVFFFDSNDVLSDYAIGELK